MKININSELKVIIKPILFLVVLIILSLIVVKEGVGRISSLKGELEVEKKNEAVLSQKESFLREIQSSVSTNMEFSLAAVPARNPALIVLSQLKKLSLDKEVILSNVKIGTETKEADLSSIQIRFDIDGNLSSVVDFTKSINNLLPISLVEKVKLASQGETSRANVSIKVFFSPYPKKLTSLTESLTDLSTEEKNLLSKLTQLIMPDFVEVQPFGPGMRTNPFE
jgi:Tfp pilus assembly protein PilO